MIPLFGAMAKLRRDEEELCRIVDLIPQSIIVLNPDRRAIYDPWPGNTLVCHRHGIDDRKRAEDRMRNETVALPEEITLSFMFEEIVGSS
jgi:hypothetical protein